MACFSVSILLCGPAQGQWEFTTVGSEKGGHWGAAADGDSAEGILLAEDLEQTGPFIQM